MPNGIPGSSPPCSVADCAETSRAQGLCPHHYRLWMRVDGRRVTPERVARFWAKVDKNGPVPDYAPHLGPCWIWLAAKSRGYGLYLSNRAHRWSYELLVGPIPDGLELDHLCRVPSCVNPAHLEPVTGRVNILRGMSLWAIRARQTHCIHGHELSGHNLLPGWRGERQCRTCHNRINRARQQRSRDAKKAARLTASGG